MKIIYDADSGVFITCKKGKMSENEPVQFVDYEVNNKLHEFFVNLWHILGEYNPQFLFGEERCTLKRIKPGTGEILACTLPYSTCYIYINTPYHFIDMYL